jgi:hypothetical protein
MCGTQVEPGKNIEKEWKEWSGKVMQILYSFHIILIFLMD